jgi:hypothetical protein
MRVMQRKPVQLLKLGDVLNGTILKPVGGRRFAVRCAGVPHGWKVELHTRRPELVQEGANATFWVAKIAALQGEVLVHDGEYGRLPISDAMRPRYLAALQALVGEGEATADTLADARSMVLQIGKKQQADWLTVWRLLGEPSTGDAKVLLADVDKLRAIRKDAPETLAGEIAQFAAVYGDILRGAIRRLVAL